MPARLGALAAVAAAGYPVGVTTAPTMPTDACREEYADLLDGIAAATSGADLTVEWIAGHLPHGRLLYWT